MLVAVCRGQLRDLLGRGHAMVGPVQRLVKGRGLAARRSARYFGTHREIEALEPDEEDGHGLRRYTRIKPPKNPILSLDPAKFTSVGQQPINLSPVRWAVFGPQSRRRVLLYYPSGSDATMKFPPEARGYLYYKPPVDGRPDVSGSLRFRVLPPGSTSFDQGTDLRTPQGKPWQTLLYSIAKFDNYRPVATMLAREGLVASRTLEQLRALPVFRIRNRSVVLYSLSEPFLTDMSYMPTSIFIITPHAMLAWQDFYQSALIVNLEKGTIGSRFPFKGLIRVRLEKSPLPQHANTHHIALRVLEIIEPVECVIPDYQYQIATPVAGELLMRTRLGKTKYSPWTFDLDKKGKGLDPLFKEEVKGP